jgi:hypothetical protein
MTYVINNSRNQLIAVVPDGTINTTATSQTLVGKNVTPYGELEMENLVHQLENFANSSPPINPILGQLWFDTSENILKVYGIGNFWKSVKAATAAPIAPTNDPVIGDLWFDTNARQLKIYDIVGSVPTWLPSTKVSVSGAAPVAVIAGELYFDTGQQNLFVFNGLNWIPVGPDISIGILAGNGIAISGSPLVSSGNITVTNTGVTNVGVGPGISTTAANGAITLTNTGVTNVGVGPGISTTAANGAITLTNTGVTNVGVGPGISTTAANGAITLTNTGVTKITAGTNIFVTPSDGVGNVIISTSFSSVITGISPAPGSPIEISGPPINPVVGIASPIPVANGGTGGSSFSSGSVLLGNNTNGFQVVAPGTNGNILTALNGAWVSQAATGVNSVSAAPGGPITIGGTSSAPVVSITNPLPVSNGGTGTDTLGANAVVLGNGTGPVTAVSPGNNGNALISNGSTWVSQAIATGGVNSVSAAPGSPITVTGTASAPVVGITNPIPTANGGTGFSSYSSGELLIGNAVQNTLNKLAAGSTGQVLTVTGPGTLAWQSPASGGVTSLLAGTGLSVNQSTGNVTISNSGVTKIIAGTNIGISPSDGTGNVTISSTVSRTTITATTISLSPNAQTNLDLLNGAASYILLQIGSDFPARIRIYSSDTARTADVSRPEGTDPLPGSGIISEVITFSGLPIIIPGAFTQNMTPAVAGFTENAANTIPLRVTNKDNTNRVITIYLKLIKLEY